MARKNKKPATPPSSRAGEWPLVVFLILFGWLYWPVFTALAAAWHSDPEYSHGYFVVPLALFVAWSRRATLPAAAGPSWWGAALLFVGLASYLGGSFLNIQPVEQFSLVVTLAGGLWLLRGTPSVRWAAPMILFLVFMIPLPYSVAVARAGQLQRWSAVGASYLLQAAGIPAMAEGNTIQLERERLDVAYACSGLQMMVAFLAVTTAAALLSDATFTGKALMMASAIPIAIACNIVRITATGMGYQFFDSNQVRIVFHDFGGWMLIPVALALLFLGRTLFDRVFPVRRSH